MMRMEWQIHRAAIGGLGPWELVIVLVIVLVVFGAGKLPRVGASLGEALKNFKKSVGGSDDDKDQPTDNDNDEETS